MNEIISKSSIEDMSITSFLEIAVFDKAVRLFAADKPIVFRLTEKEKLAVQEKLTVYPPLFFIPKSITTDTAYY